ncbi:MAG: hypothetical protein KA440_08430 [Azonexus sp.]|nr:hypothetical protein [Azonexus sp.]
MKCKNCMYFEPNHKEYPPVRNIELEADIGFAEHEEDIEAGFCHRFPPSVREEIGAPMSEIGEVMRWSFPSIHRQEWCGEFKPPNAKSEPTSAALSREVGSTDGL